MENLARVHKEEFEKNTEKVTPTPVTHPEAANDGPVANDNAPVITPEDRAQIEALKLHLNEHAVKGEEPALPEQIVEVPQTIDPENTPVTTEAQPGSAETGSEGNAPETAQASGGAEREDGDGVSGGGRRTPDLRVVERDASSEKKKGKFGWIGKVLAFPFKLLGWAGALTALLYLSALRALSNSGLKRVGYPDKGKGGGTKS